MENKAIFMHGTNDMIWKEIPVPEIGEEDVLIKVEAELQSFIMVPHFLQEMQEADLLKSEDIFLKMICLRQSLLYRMIFSITQELQPISGYCQIKRQVQSEKEKCS